MAVEVELGAYLTHLGVFSHNPLHDLESLWWVGVWFLSCHYKPSRLGVNTVQTHVKVVKKFSQTLFNNPTDSHRRSVLTGKSALLNTKPQNFPPPVFPFFLVLSEFRAQLLTYYKSYQPREPRDRSFFTPDLHRGFADIVERGLEALRNNQSELWPLDHVEDRIAFLSAKK
jgi:hypothetical protein